MSLIALELDQGQEARRPGGRLGGVVTWIAERPPDAIEIRLFWVATGGSQQQIGRVETILIPRPLAEGESRFEFTLPAGPWSFFGRLAQLNWFVEGILQPVQACARREITVGPTGAATLLYGSEPEGV